MASTVYVSISKNIIRIIMMSVIKIKSQVYRNHNTYMQLKTITILIRMLTFMADVLNIFQLPGFILNLYL